MRKLWIGVMLVALLAAGLPGYAQGGRQPITGDNATQLVELIRLGRGSSDRVAFAPDGGTIAVASTVGVWLYPAAGVSTATEPPLLETAKPVKGLAYSPDGRTLAVSFGDEVQFWDVAAMQMTGSMRPARSSQAVAYSPDGSLLAINMGSGGISLWDLAAGAERLLITGSIQSDAAVVFSPDGSLLAGSTTDYKGHLWRVADGSEAALLEGHSRYLYDFVFSPDSSVIATASYDNTVRMWDVASGTELASLAGTDAQRVDGAYAIAVSPDGMMLVSGHANGLVVVWDVNAMAPGRVFGPGSGTGNIVDLAFSPDGAQIVTVSSAPGVMLWDAASGAEIARAVGHTPYVSAAAFSPDSAVLAISDWDGNIWPWSTAGMQELNFTTPAPELVSTGLRNDQMLGYSPDGSVLAASNGFDVILLDPVTGAERSRLTACSGTSESFVFSPDSTLLAEASSSGVCVYNLATGQQMAFFPAGDWLNTVDWSPDQTLIATTGKDHTVRVYGLP